jgi:hypothetical protein
MDRRVLTTPGQPRREGAMNRFTERTIAAIQIAVALTAAALALPPLAVQAQQDGRQACVQDAFAFCGPFIPDHERVGACLFANLSRISPACRDLVKHFTPRTAAAR